MHTNEEQGLFATRRIAEMFGLEVDTETAERDSRQHKLPHTEVF